MRDRSRLVALAAALALALGCAAAGCVGTMAEGFDDGVTEPSEYFDEGAIPVEEEEIDEEAFESDEGAGHLASTPGTVGDVIDQRRCSTSPTMPLNAQIAEQMNCIEDGFFARIDDIGNVSLGSGANPFLQRPAAAALRRVAASRPGTTFTVTSSWRSVVQQYVLRSWQGSCGISIAARPGRSNHESGLAIDVPSSTTTSFRTALRDNGFRWYCDATNGGSSSGCRDRPHHDYTAGGADLRSRSVLAFQQLWNHAHPEERISEDGVFGNQTASCIRRAPVVGFSTGTTCGAPTERCGDDRCTGGESCDSCPGDCGECPAECGDGTCDDGEDCGSCERDCGECPESCGDGWCDPSAESCGSCPSDCGECSAGCGIEGHLGAGDNGDPCSAPAESWRCVVSERWETEVSQVCRDGSWLTFELDPRDCEACCGDYSTACRP